MDIQLIEGKFDSKEALELLTQMIDVKIKFHESKIEADSTEEDMKWRESKIKNLQNVLKATREYIVSNDRSYKIVGTLKID